MKVFIFQPALPNYRIDLFKKLNNFLNNNLTVYYSDSNLGILSKIKNQYGWAKKIGELIEIFPGIYWQAGSLSINISQADCIVVCGSPRDLSTIFLLIKAKLRNKKTIWWGHYWSSTSTKFRQRIRIYISRLSNAYLFYTDEEVQKFKKAGWKSKKLISALNNGLDLKNISSKRKEYISIERPLNIFFIGRLTKKTNIYLLINALYLIKTKEYKLNIIGDGPEIINIKKTIRRLDLTNVVYLHGEISDEGEISRIANKCSVFVYPGSVGLSLIHAMAYGLPAIVHDNISHQMPEIAAFKNFLTGLNFKENSASDLAKVIKKLMKSNSLRQKMSFNSIKIVSDKFNTKNMSKRFFDFLNKVVN